MAYKFTLDGFGRISGASYEDSDQIFYDYNTEGDLGLVRHGDLITRYYYDFQGELIGVLERNIMKCLDKEKET